MALTDQANVTSQLAAILIGAVATFVLFAASLAVPPVGFLSGMLAPYPVMYFRFKQGRSVSLCIVLAALVGLVSAFGGHVAVTYLMQCGVIALVLPELLLRGLGGGRSIAWTTACNLALLVVVAVAYAQAAGQNLHHLVTAEIKSSIAQAVTLYEKSGVKGDELNLVKQTMNLAADLAVRMYPALVTILVMSVAGCNLALLRRPAERMGLKLALGEFAAFRLPDLTVWVLIASGFAMLAGTPLVTTPALNVLIVVLTLYFLQGLAVISTLFARQPFGGMLKVGLYLMLLIQPYLAAVIAAVGIFDLWGNFRTPKQQENL